MKICALNNVDCFNCEFHDNDTFCFNKKDYTFNLDFPCDKFSKEDETSE